MKHHTLYIALIVLLAASPLLGACGRGPDIWQPGPNRPVGPQGPVGPGGDVGPQGNLGPSSENAIQIKATGVLVEREYPLGGFSEIKVSDLFEAEIRQGETYRVTVEAEEAITPYLEIVVRGETLQIGLNPNYTYNIDSTSQRVAVTLPDLTRVEITDLCSASIHDFRNLGDIEIKVSDLSSLSANIEADSVRLDIREHSTVDLVGVAQAVAGNIEGLSTLDLSNLDAGEVNVVSDQFSEIVE